MRQPPWKSLVKRLQQQDDFHSPYLDRLSRQLGVCVESYSIEREIAEEMANALTRSGNKLTAALLELDLARHEAAKATGPALRRAKIDEHNELRAKAKQARWELIVHRESLGLFRHGVIDDDFPVPPVLREEHLPPIGARPRRAAE